jgi:hypothetical protein
VALEKTQHPAKSPARRLEAIDCRSPRSRQARSAAGES